MANKTVVNDADSALNEIVYKHVMVFSPGARDKSLQKFQITQRSLKDYEQQNRHFCP